MVVLNPPYIRHIQKTIGATAGNVTTNLSPGLNKRWSIKFGQITCVNDATVATRNIILQVTNGSNVVYGMAVGASGTTAQTKSLGFGPLVNVVSGNYSQDAHMGLSQPLILEGVDQFRISIQNGVAGDSYSGYLIVEETDV